MGNFSGVQQANGAGKSLTGGAGQFANEPSSGYELETRGSIIGTSKCGISRHIQMCFH